MTKTTLMEFPCNFPIKIIGSNSQDFLNEITLVVKKHFPNFIESSLSHKLSGTGNYLAITVTVLALNQAMLDAFYQDVTKNPDVKMVL